MLHQVRGVRHRLARVVDEPDLYSLPAGPQSGVGEQRTVGLVRRELDRLSVGRVTVTIGGLAGFQAGGRLGGCPRCREPLALADSVVAFADGLVAFSGAAAAVVGQLAAVVGELAAVVGELAA